MELPPPKNLKYIATLALVATVILLVGSLLRPRASSADLPPPSDSDLARLQRFTERRSLDSTTTFFNQLADDVAPFVVRLAASDTSGVVWAAGTVATARLEASFAVPPPVISVVAEARATGADWAPDLPVAGVYVTEAVAGTPAPRVEAPARAGDSLLAVWRTDAGRALAPAVFSEVAPIPCDGRPSREVRSTLSLTRSMAGGGLFDLDGRLVGLILPCGDRFAAVTPDVVDDMLRLGASFESRLLARYGLVVDSLSAAETAYFEAASGAIVRELWVGRAAEQAGLRPGDIIVGLNGVEVSGADDLRALAGSSALANVVLSARRGTAALELALAGGEGEEPPGVPPTSGVVWEAPPPGFRIGVVIAGSRAAAAGIKAGDRLVRIGQAEPTSLDQVRRLLDAPTAAPAFVEVQRDGRLWGAVVTGAEP